MVRTARRSRLLLVVAIGLAGLMAAPFDACDDYASLDLGASTAYAGWPYGAIDEPDGAPGGTAHLHVCCCIVCDLTTDDSFAPRLPSPRCGETVPPIPAVANTSTYLPDIFRPPIV